MTPERWEKIEKLYHSVLECVPPERANFLDRACGGDRELRREVESLLQQNGSIDVLLEHPALEMAANMLKQNPAESLIGRRLGVYEILSLAGAGGMGEVYKAKDTRLNRIVAIKVLPAHLADRPDLRDRFKREAQAIASLNHPHICTLYDIGHQDGIDFLVMEYLEGETLAQRLEGSALPLDVTLQYAIEIADALDKAHRKGFTHRDLKPGNIMLTKSGTKLLDFGLAKLRPPVSPGVSATQAPTEPPSLTVEGAILGTLQYMPPEQIEGKEIDARTDIFAFGAVLYEMITGRKAFTGETRPRLMSAIIKDHPPSASQLIAGVPPALDRCVNRCLAKEPDKRWQTASDLYEELKWIAESRTLAQTPVQPLARKQTIGYRMVVLCVALLAAAGVIGIAVSSKPPTHSQPVSRFTIKLPPNQRIGITSPYSSAIVAVSPDGSRIVYIATDESGKSRLFLRDLDSLESRPLPGTEDANGSPFFSPDGEWVGFFAGGVRLAKLPVSGGSAVTICSVNSGYMDRSAAWGANDKIVFSVGGQLMAVSAAGGEPRTLHHDGRPQRSPQFLPGGKAFISYRRNSPSDPAAEIVAESLDTGEQHVILQGGFSPQYVPSGQLVFYRDGNLFAVPFDADTLSVHGTPVPILEGVHSGSQESGTADYSVSSTGTLVYIPGIFRARDRNLVWVDRKGAAQLTSAPVRGYDSPRFSLDGKKVAMTIAGPGKADVWVYDLQRGTLTRLTFDGSNSYPRWTPDGKRISYESNKNGISNLFWKLADGTGDEEQITSRPYYFKPGSFTPDGKLQFYIETNPKTGKDIWAVSLQDHKSTPVVELPADQTNATISPDGHWLAYDSNESGRYEVYVRPYPGPGGKWQISTDGGDAQAWSRDGKELFYMSGEKMMAVQVSTSPTFSAGTPKLLFEGHFAKQPGQGANYDISPDGQKFLMLQPAPQPSESSQINVVLNWTEELKRKVPTGK